ncbi:MAG: hypothetical protein ACRDBO_20140 [Lachnospiraceae bacterium]
MSFTAVAALDPADTDVLRLIARFDPTDIVGMYSKSTRKLTGAGKLVELKRRNGVIIKILRRRVVIIDE